MARPKLSSKNQSLPVRGMLVLYEGLASLILAVVLLLLLAAVLAWATFLERDYGTEAVHFAVYDSWWLAALLGLLGINVLCAALIRFPWRRYQTGFLITHAGILVLLVGCIYSAASGIDAQLPLFEGGIGHTAYERTRHFELKLLSDRPDASSNRVMDIPFASGPFNWNDYRNKPFFPWHVGHRDRGKICDQDGIKLEVLDYFRDWSSSQAKPLVLRAAMSGPGSDQFGAFEDVTLSPRTMGMGSGGPRFSADAERLKGGVRFSYRIAASQVESEAFQLTGPEGDLGKQGQIAIYARGNVFRFQVDDLQSGQRKKLGSTGCAVEFVGTTPSFLGLELRLLPPHGEAQTMILFAETPEFNVQAPDYGIFGNYWLDAESPLAAQVADSAESLHNPKEPRIDLLQESSGKLLSRVWQSPILEPARELIPEEQVDVAAGPAGRSIRFYVDSYEPCDHAGEVFSARPFDKKSPAGEPLLLVRLAVDGTTEEFWLEGRYMGAMEMPPGDLQKRTVIGKDRRVQITLLPDSVDVGFHVYLDKFQRKLDPGSSMASHYSSLVDFVTVKTDPATKEKVRDETIEEGVLITLNEPITRIDPKTGRSFRIYQESFRGPFKPGADDGMYDMRLGGRVLRGETMPRDELFISFLTVNYDPGRGLKYFGCMMIVAGIATMFYMKAYFFARRSSGRSEVPG